MTEDQIRELFKEMRDEPAPADSRARVRMETARRVAEKQRRWFAWPWAAGLAAVASFVVIAVVARKPESRPSEPPVVAVTKPAELKPVAPAKAKTPVVEERLVARTKRPIEVPQRPVVSEQADSRTAQVVIRIDTPDPNVVILLIGDE